MFLAHPYLLLLIIPVLAAAAYLIRKGHGKRLLITRAIVFALLIVSLASPYELVTRTTVDESPSVTVISDLTGSMALFENGTGERVGGSVGGSVGDRVYDRLKSATPTRIHRITGNRSGIGDAIAGCARGNDNILLVSDCNNNYGLLLADTIAFVDGINTTVCAIRLTPQRNDLSVEIVGGKDVIVGSEQSFAIVVRQAMDGKETGYRLSIWVDGAKIDGIYEKPIVQSGRENRIPISHTFDGVGSHTIKAEIAPTGEDYRSENNVFYKSVHVVPKPTILLMADPGHSSPLSQTLTELYETTTVSPGDLLDPGEYLAVVLDNLHANDLDKGEIERLRAYLRNGGGLVVVGGDRAYDRGGYYGSPLGFEALLPVRSKESAGTGKNMGVVIVIDISGSVGTTSGGGSALSMEKALAISILRGISANDYVGVIAFNQNAHIVSPLTRGLYKGAIEEDIARLKHGGQTQLDVAQNAAFGMLEGYSGAKSVIVISDGQTKNADSCISIAGGMADSGITTYTVGVGETTDESFMQSLAEAGGGIYYKPTESERLNVIFGDKPKEPADTTKGDFSVVVLNPNHFISEGVMLSGSLTGYNTVTPKVGAQPLVTTSAGKPIVTAWMFGVGHVVSLATDDGSGWSGVLYSGENAAIISRMVNWAVGDPRRNDEVVITGDDVHLGEPAVIEIRSSTIPSMDLNGRGLELSQIDEDRYQASIPTEVPGLLDVSGYAIAVNYPLEFRDVGASTDLQDMLEVFGGGVYDEDAILPLLDNMRAQSTRTVQEQKDLRLWFLLAAMLIFLCDVAVRRLREIARMRNG